MLSLKLVDLSGLDNMRRTTLETQLHQVVGVSSDSGGGSMSKEVVDAETEKRRTRENRALAKALAAEKDRQVRLHSVARDIELGLPVSIQQPDGEEFPRKCPMQLKSYDQHAEIVKGFIQGPPNKTICNYSDWGSNGSGLEVRGRSTSKSNSCSCLLPGQQQQQQQQKTLLNFLKPSSSTTISSAAYGGGGGGDKSTSSPPHSRASPKCHVHSRPVSSSSSATTKSTHHKPTKDKDSPSSSTHSSLTSLPTHKPSIAEKIHNMFSDQIVSSSSSQAQPNSNQQAGGGFAARVMYDETKMKSKSSKMKGHQSTLPLGKLKGDLKKNPNQPLLLSLGTERHVFTAMPTPVSIPMGIWSGDGTGGGCGGKSENGAERPILFHGVDERDGERMRSSDDSSDRNGNERERAWSDSMVRTSRPSLGDTTDLSQSRMSLCCEGEDINGGTSSPSPPDWEHLNSTPPPTCGIINLLPTEPHGYPSTSRHGQSEHDPTSFLYQHIYQPPTATPTDSLNFDTR